MSLYFHAPTRERPEDGSRNPAKKSAASCISCRGRRRVDGGEWCAGR